jgi:hypothetical protein
MMSGGAFILLKVGCLGPESTKQAEIRLANLLKILRNFGSEAKTPRQGGKIKDGFSAISVGHG